MDHTDKNKIEELLPRYCEGLATAEERLQVETWMNEPKRRRNHACLNRNYHNQAEPHQIVPQISHNRTHQRCCQKEYGGGIKNTSQNHQDHDEQ